MPVFTSAVSLDQPELSGPHIAGPLSLLAPGPDLDGAMFRWLPTRQHTALGLAHPEPR